MKSKLIVVAALLATLSGCGAPAKTEIDPASSAIKSKTTEKRPTETTTTKMSVTTAPAVPPTYRLKIVRKEPPCERASSPSLPASPSPSPSPSPEPTPKR